MGDECSRNCEIEGGALLGEFFVDGLHEFIEVEGLFEDATGSKKFRHIEEIAVALGAGHGDDFGVEVFSRQLQGRFEAIRSWHEDVHEDQVHFILLVQSQALPTVAGFEHTMVGSLKDFLQEAPDRFFVVDNKDCSHSERDTRNVFDLTYVGFSCLGRS